VKVVSDRVYEVMIETREIPRLVLFKVKVIRGMSWSLDTTGAQRAFESVKKQRKGGNQKDRQEKNKQRMEVTGRQRVMKGER
jgi:hypothetical protein